MVGLKILLFVVCKLVLLAQTDQQNGQTSHKGEQNDKSYQKKVKISRKVYQKGQKGYPTSYKKFNKIFQFQKGSAHQHGTAFGIVDGNCSYWCYGEQKKNSVQLPLLQNFSAMDLTMHLAQWMYFSNLA